LTVLIILLIGWLPVHAQQQIPTLFVIGDSTVKNSTKGLQGWGDPIASFFDQSKIKIENRARGGRSSRTFQTEGLWDQILTELKSGDFVLLQFGHNDGGAINDNARARGSLKGTGNETEEIDNLLTKKHEVVHTFGWYMRKYVDDAKAKGAIPIVLSPIPRNIWQDAKVVRASADYGKWTSEIARSEGAFFIDLNELVARRYDSMGPEKVKELFLEDHTHTTPAGAYLNAEAVVEGLRSLRACPLNKFLMTNHDTSVAAIVLWPDGAPGAVGSEPLDVPTLTPYLPPKQKASGAAVIVCPGGGYNHLADHEGGPVGEWLSTLGITAFVLKYRFGPRYRHPAPLLDAARAIRTVRARASEWGIDPKRIGILGFSAGGHLAATIGTHFDSGQAEASDPIERVSSRPDLMILIYPVITMRDFTHSGSKKMLLGDNPSPDMVALLSNDEQVTKDTPPAFLVHTADDPGVPVENSLRFAAALRRNRVAVEIHIYEHGPHGFGLGGSDPILSTWPQRCAEWLRAHGFVSK
jgi:acetyl esterase/lipase